MSMWSNTDVKPVKKTKDLTFDQFWNPHTDESTCNEHVKQYWCETSENFRESDQSPELDLLWGPKWSQTIVHISESSSNEHIKQVWCEYRENKIVENLNFEIQRAYKSSFVLTQSKRFKKIDENQYVDLFWHYLGPKTARKFGPQGPLFTHTWKYPQCSRKTSCMLLY